MYKKYIDPNRAECKVTEISELKTSQTNEIKNMTIIYYVLTFSPIVYLLLLVILQETTIEINQTNQQDPLYYVVFPILFSFITFIQILAVYFYFIPNFMKIDNFNELYGSSLIMVTIFEAISIYGLLIGLLQGFGETGEIFWPYVIALNLLSVLLNYDLVTRIILPRLYKTAEE